MLENHFLSVKSFNDVFYDLVDFGRYQELSSFLREVGEFEKADKIDTIDSNLNDSCFFSEMYSIIIGDTLKISLKPEFQDCFSIEAPIANLYDDKLDVDIKLFNHVVFNILKTTEYPVGKLTEEEFPLLDNEDVLVKEDIFRLLRESGVGVPAYYEEITFEVDGKKGTYCRSRSGCYFCFFQQRIEWIWLYEQHPDLFAKAMEFEKDGYSWIQGEPLMELIKPERIRQIKLDIIKKQEAAKANNQGTTLVDILGDEIMCSNCFI